TEKPWAVPANRIARDAWYKCKRATEEITRVNVEVARLRSWMEQEELIYQRTLDKCSVQSPPLAMELSRRLELVHQAHRRIRRDLERIPSISGYKPGFMYTPNQ